MTTERAASDHASQEVPRELILPTPCSCSLVPDVTTPLYSSTVSRALRQALRGHAVANFLELRYGEVRLGPGPMGRDFSGSCVVTSRNALLHDGATNAIWSGRFDPEEVPPCRSRGLAAEFGGSLA